MSLLISVRTHLEKLQSILNYEMHFLIISIFFVMFPSIGTEIINVVMILFIPYVVFVLYKMKKYGWLMFLGVFVVTPMLNQIWGFFGFKLTEQLVFIPLFFFLIYLFFLKLVIRDWLEDLNAKLSRRYKTDLSK